jgi:hypothetical protein
MHERTTVDGTVVGAGSINHAVLGRLESAAKRRKTAASKDSPKDEPKDEPPKLVEPKDEPKDEPKPVAKPTR